MRYYSEDTVRKIIRIFAHTALEQSSLYADHILQNQPSIEIKTSHGRLIDADKLKKKVELFTITRVDECLKVVVNGNYIVGQILDNAPTVLEASK